MKKKYFGHILLAILPILSLAACKDSKSYSELLDDEEKAVNSFLAHQRVVAEVPVDTLFEFETGENAPYYKLDEDGTVYMQVLKTGDRENNKARYNQNIYFRYGRISLISYAAGNDDTPVGNFGNMNGYEASFRYNNYSLATTYEWGSGIQMPLKYLGIDCEVNLLIKSQSGFSSEITNVIPYLYNVRYFRSKN